MSSSVHVDNKKKVILILGEESTQGLDGTKLTAEKCIFCNTFCLSLNYNGVNNYLFVNGTEIIKFNAINSEILATPLRLANILKDFSVDNMKQAGLNE